MLSAQSQQDKYWKLKEPLRKEERERERERETGWW